MSVSCEVCDSYRDHNPMEHIYRVEELQRQIMEYLGLEEIDEYPWIKEKKEKDKL